MSRLYRIQSTSGLAVELSAQGAAIRRVLVPQRDGPPVNVVLGLEDDIASASHCFGTAVGRYANRIAGGRFTLGGETYQLPLNDGENSLHGGPEGLHRHVWDVVAADQSSVSLRTVSPDGEMGYPGALVVDVTYSLRELTLRIDYRATTDAPTIVNLTNHTYWNLAGEGSGSVEGHLLELSASAFTPVGAGLIPTGQISPVVGTPLDFRVATPVGARLRDASRQLALARGYDHNFVIDRPAPAALAFAARVVEPVSGRSLEVYTTEPGVQLYTGNLLDGTLIGLSERAYRQGDGLALETQHFPDSPNQPSFPSTVLRPGEEFASTTAYRFRP